MCFAAKVEASRALTVRGTSGIFRRMSTITIPLTEEDLSFLRTYSEAQGTSAEAFLARQAHNLREQMQRPLHGAVAAASGIIAPEIAGREAHREHLEKKQA